MVSGRPRKYKEGAQYSSVVFYYPSNSTNQVVLEEFGNVCNRTKDIEFYSEKVAKKGMILRRFIYIKVLLESRNNKIRNMALSLLLQEINECIKRYNKSNKENKPLLTEDDVLARYGIEFKHKREVSEDVPVTDSNQED